jgi:hypothetical protein
MKLPNEVMKKIAQAIKDFGIIHRGLDGVYIREDLILEAISQIELPYDLLDENRVKHIIMEALFWGTQHNETTQEIIDNQAHSIASRFVSKKYKMTEKTKEILASIVVGKGHLLTEEELTAIDSVLVSESYLR